MPLSPATPTVSSVGPSPFAPVRQHSLLTVFRAHPASIGETYLEHMRFALCIGGRLMCAAAAAIVHAIVPPWFETTAGGIVRQLVSDMERRKGQHQRKAG